MRKYYLILSALILFTAGYWLTASYQYNSTKGKEMQVFDLNLDAKEDIIEGTKVWSVVDKKANLVCYSLIFKNAGSAYEEKRGLCSVLKEMMTEGAGDLDAYHFQEYLLNNQIQFHPSFDDDNFYITVRTTPDNLKASLHALERVFQSLTLSGKNLDRIKQQIVLGLQQSKQDPSSIVGDRLSEFAFEKHPYHATIDEYIASIPDVGENILRDHLKNYFAKDNLSVVVTGNMSDLSAFVNEVRSFLSEARKSDVKIEMMQFKNAGETEYFFMDVPQSVIKFVMPSIDRNHPDFYALYVFNAALGGVSHQSKLFDEVREKRGLAYYVSSSIAFAPYLNVFKGVTATGTEQADDAVRIIKQTIENYIKSGVTEEELDFIKQYMTGSFITQFDSLLDTCNMLRNYMSNDLPLSYINERNKIIRDLTVEKVNNAAKTHLKPEELTFVIVGRHNVKPSDTE